MGRLQLSLSRPAPYDTRASGAEVVVGHTPESGCCITQTWCRHLGQQDSYWMWFALCGAFIQNWYYYGADFSRANLKGTYLSWCDMLHADLREVDFRNARIDGVFFLEADLRAANFNGVDFGENTILPDGSHWTPEVDMGRFTNPAHPDFYTSGGATYHRSQT